MRTPTRDIAGNLTWTRSGTVWAHWMLSGVPFGFRQPKDKQVVRQLHTALLRSLPGESLLLGVGSGLDPAVVVGRMLEGVDLERCPQWVAECEATLDSLDRIGIGQRVFWLAVPLASARPQDKILAPLRAAGADLRDRAGLPRAGVSPDEVERRMAQAGRIAQSLPAPFSPEPATAAQMVWLHEHAQRRGLFQDLDLPEGSDDVATQLLTPRAGTMLADPLLDEGGQSDITSAADRAAPWRRRYLKVQDVTSIGQDDASYQVMMAIADVPDGGFLFPGGEVIGRIDESGVDVDWAMRLTIKSSHEVQAANQRALRNLNEQYSQRSLETSHALNMLDKVSHDLAEYVGILDSDKLEVETQATMIMTVAGPTAESAQAQAMAVSDWFHQAGYKLSAPLGGQEELWWAMQPGVPTTRLVREFAQITTSHKLAALVPMASTRLGDVNGSVLALNITNGPLLAPNLTCGPSSVVMHDLEGSSDRNVSGSAAIGGELGAGKALALDTPIPTPNGWTLMGELVPGDLVFDELGRPTPVVATSPVMEDHTCYRVTFSDGSTIVADADHLWTTIPDRLRGRAAKTNHKARAAGRVTVSLDEALDDLTGPGWHTTAATVTTEQIRGSLKSRGQANHAIPLAGALELPDADLPIDPYVLGAWLGDGHSSDSRVFSADPEVLTNIEAAGYQVRKLADDFAYAISIPGEHPGTAEIRPCLCCGQPMDIQASARLFCSAACAHNARKDTPGRRVRSCQVCGGALPRTSSALRCARCLHSATLHGRLRILGVRNNKHIPGQYLRASLRQRKALLAGLLDTDGTVSPRGAVEYTTTSSVLAHGVLELACSLGYRARIRHRVARLEGRDCGTAWTISFSTTDPVFHHTRKRKVLQQRTENYSAARNKFRYIVDVQRVDSVPVRCIRVAAASSLFLAGPTMIPTHNTATLMKLAGDLADRGGQLVALDRTAKAEWASWAAGMNDAAVVVDASDPQLSLDPLRVFGPQVGSRMMATFLTPLLNVRPTSERGVLLSDVLDADYLREHDLDSAGTWLHHLDQDCPLEGAHELARLVNVFARRSFGKVIFDGTIPELDPSSRAIVFLTRSLSLPSREELELEHLFEQLGPDKLFGRALNALIAAVARHIAFADTSTMAGFIVSEAHAVTASFEGERELIEYVRDGRKHRAVALIDTHDPLADLGSPTLRGLIQTRILMRHQDKTLAQRGLEWLDLDPADEALVDMVRHDTSPLAADGSGVPVHRRGEALMRDTSGRVGRIKVLLPARAEREAAITAGGTASARGSSQVGERS